MKPSISPSNNLFSSPAKASKANAQKVIFKQDLLAILALAALATLTMGHGLAHAQGPTDAEYEAEMDMEYEMEMEGSMGPDGGYPNSGRNAMGGDPKQARMEAAQAAMASMLTSWTSHHYQHRPRALGRISKLAPNWEVMRKPLTNQATIQQRCRSSFRTW